MKNCNEISELLSLYLDNRTDEKTTGEIEKHLAQCIKCKQELDDLKYVVTLCRDINETDLPEGFSEKLHERLVEESKEINRTKPKVTAFNKYIKIGSSIAAVLLMAVVIRGLWAGGVFSSLHSSSSSAGNKVNTAAAPAATAPLAQNSKDKNSGSGQNAPMAKSAPITGDNTNNDAAFAAKQNDQFATYEMTEPGNTSKSTNSMAVSRSSSNMDIKGTLPAGSFFSKSSEVNIICDKPFETADEIEKTASQFGSDISKDSKLTVTTEKNTPLIIRIKILNSDYTKFTDSLKNNYPTMDVTIGNVTSVDITPQINNLNRKINTLNTEITANSASDTGNSAVLKEDLLNSQNERTQLEENSNYTLVTLIISDKKN
ncbi:MAG: zf-HC2 domain-containing protein [Bacillota bacterium]|nr:zf-HC2 domain-containing protein [Bacillota bacterium]